MPFGKEKYRALGITQKNDDLFTNLALIISDQCAHTTKVAVFGDDANTTFKDNKEFGGSIFTQLEDTFDYLMLCNRTTASFKGLERIEKQDYPRGSPSRGAFECNCTPGLQLQRTVLSSM